MPVLCRFYGIIIRMYFFAKEHNSPHIHAIYGDDYASLKIEDGSIMIGHLPQKKLYL